MPLREDLFRAQKIRCNKFIVQSDNTKVIETMQNGVFSSTSSASVFYDCSLALGFTSVEFSRCL
jgi:hypothetical protein